MPSKITTAKQSEYRVSTSMQQHSKQDFDTADAVSTPKLWLQKK